MAELVVTGTKTTSIGVKIQGMSAVTYARTATIFCNGGSKKTFTVSTSGASVSTTFTGLKPNTKYTFTAYVYKSSDLNYPIWSSGTVTESTEPEEEPDIVIDRPSLSFSPSRTSCVITWVRPRGANQLRYKCWPHGSSSEPSSYTSTDAYNERLTLTGLKAGTSYKVSCYYYTNTSGYENSSERYYSTAFTTRENSTFSWSITPRKNASFSITKNDWDNLQNIIDERRDYNRNWAYTASRGGKLTANMWNEVIDALNNSSASGVPKKVDPGSPCVASVFIDLQNSVNSI